MAVWVHMQAMHSFQARPHRGCLLADAMAGGVDGYIGPAAGSGTLAVLVLGSSSSRSH